MGRPIINLIGNTYGNLTVVKRVERPEHNDYGTFWLCKCECGGEKIVDAGELKRGNVQSCGCMRFNNLENKIFGRLTVLHIDKNAKLHNDGSLKWVCQCNCGNIKTISSSSLVKGKTKSCGCLKKEITKVNFKHVEKYHELYNKKFSKLTVLEKSIEKNGYWICKCECGNKTEVHSYNLVYNQTKSCGCLVSSGEDEVIKILLKYDINFKKQYTFPEWTNTEYWRYKFDFAIFDESSNLKFIIEYDGFHHFGFSNKAWNTEEHYYKIIKRDNFKSNYCNENKIPLLRIPYWNFDNIEEILLKWLKKFNLNIKNI